jgi:hypothetical protein
MTKLEATYEALERRARAVTAFAWCGRLLAGAGLLALGASVAAGAAAWSFHGLQGVVLALVLLGGVSGYLIGRSRPVDVSAVLLTADVKLGTEARLSTLHAIRDKHDLRPFALRIAAGLPSRPLSARIALPIPGRHVAMVVGGALLGAIAVVLIGVLPPRDGRFAQSQEPFADERGTHVGPDPAAAAPEPSKPQPNAREDQDDALSKAPTSGAPLTSLPSLEETLTDLGALPVRPQAAASLEETLREIDRRLSQEDASLTESEVRALQSFAEGASGPLAAALRELLSASTQETTLAQIRTVLADPDLSVESRDLVNDKVTSPLHDAVEPMATLEDAQNPAASTRPAVSSEPTDAPSDRTGAFPFFDDAAGTELEIALIGVTLPSSIGEAGGYSYYVTKSVPIEPVGDSSPSAGAPVSLSFEQASSIAAGRALPSDVLEAVRAYFTQITEGGP